MLSRENKNLLLVVLAGTLFMVIPTLANINKIEENPPVYLLDEKIEFKKAIKDDYIKFFVEYLKIDKALLEQMSEAELKSLAMQTQAYKFTAEKINQMIQDTINPPEGALTRELGYLSEDERYPETDDVPKTSNKSKGRSPSGENSSFAPQAFSSSYQTLTRAADQSGSYYLVKAAAGAQEVTAYATLPTIHSMDENDRAYMFFSANIKNDTTALICQDFGVVYEPGVGWYPCISAVQWNYSTASYNIFPYGEDRTWFAGNEIDVNKIYLRLTVTNNNSMAYFRLRVYDAINHSLLWDRTIAWSDNLLDANFSNMQFDRQISMAQNNDGRLNTDTQSKFSNAKFDRAYLYQPNYYTIWNTTHTQTAFRQAPISRQLNTVTVNAYTKWDSEDVTINFNIP